jgi:hypothetical protein
VTGVQTCALPISALSQRCKLFQHDSSRPARFLKPGGSMAINIRPTCLERLAGCAIILATSFTEESQ